MNPKDFLTWQQNIEEKVSANKFVVKQIIAALTFTYNIECFNYLMRTQKHTAIGGGFQPYDIFIHSLLLKNKLSYDVTAKINYGKFSVGKVVKLGFDPVIACPWDEDRMESCLHNIENEVKLPIGCGGTMLLPFEICFVQTCGHHAVMANILKKDGVLEVNSFCDYSAVLNDIDFDGESFYLKDKPKKKVKSHSETLGLIYHLGRYLNVR
jgi:hypothetical protein